MEWVLWSVAILLAIGFGFAGITKVTRSRAEMLKAGMGWVDLYSDSFIKALGGIELLGAVGLILPGALDILPILTPIAASGFVILMIGATWIHRRRHEPISPTLVLGALSLFLAIMRFGPYPF